MEPGADRVADQERAIGQTPAREFGDHAVIEIAHFRARPDALHQQAVDVAHLAIGLAHRGRRRAEHGVARLVPGIAREIADIVRPHHVAAREDRIALAIVDHRIAVGVENAVQRFETELQAFLGDAGMDLALAVARADGREDPR